MCIHRNTLVSAVVKTLREKRSKSRWNFVKTLCPTGLTSDEVSQITLHLRNNPHLALCFFSWSQRTSLCTHDLQSYSTIIHVLARARFKTLAENLIRTAIQVSEVNSLDSPDLSSKPPKIFETLVKTYRSCDSAPFVFDLLVRACLKAKKLDRSVAIVRMLRSRNICPAIGTCNLLIRVTSQLRGSDAGLAMYREVFKLDEDISDKASATVRVTPNVQTFNILMLSFYQDRMLEKVEEIWIEMGRSNCYPNVFSYCVLLAAFCDKGKMAEAMRLWEDMRIKQIKPDVMAYNTLISGFCKSLDIVKAEELFREMALSQIEATCMTYEHLITGYCKIGDVDSAILLYKDMCRKDFKPETSTVDMVVGEMCNKGRVFEGLKFLRDVMKRQCFYPSRSTYEFLIKRLCEDGKMEEALKLQTEMVGKGFEPNLEIYRAFIGAYSKRGDKEKARNLTEEMIKIGFQLEEA